MITGALILLAGLFIGYLVGRANKQPPRPPKPTPPPRQPRPICGCEHHLALHDLKTGKCSGQSELVTHLTNHVPDKWTYYDCTCKHYVGPEYLPQYVAPEITG